MIKFLVLLFVDLLPGFSLFSLRPSDDVEIKPCISFQNDNLL